MTTTMTPTQEITTTRFGVVPYTDEDVITFEDGLVGFPTFSRYVVICPREDSPFRWLQSLEEPALAFLVAEPFHYVPDYAPTVPNRVAEQLGIDPDKPYLVFVTVSIPRGKPDEMSVNLAGPIIVEPLSRRAIQVVIEDEAYTTRHRVFQPAAHVRASA